MQRDIQPGGITRHYEKYLAITTDSMRPEKNSLAQSCQVNSVKNFHPYERLQHARDKYNIEQSKLRPLRAEIEKMFKAEQLKHIFVLSPLISENKFRHLLTFLIHGLNGKNHNGVVAQH